jgi:hypothetical protein
LDIIHLYPVLRGHHDLANLNLRLHRGEIALDWSQTQEASQEQLARLLEGLDMVEDSELLGLDTIPEALQEAISQVFVDAENKRHRKQKRSSAQIKPPETAMWEAEKPVMQEQAIPAIHVEQENKLTKAIPPRNALAQPVLQPPSASALRDELQRLVLLDLLGPAAGAEEELDESSVRDRYLVGMLAPRNRHMLPEELDELATSGDGSIEDGPNDDTALQIASLLPSSIGMSFEVDGNAQSLQVSAAWGHYQREKSETIKTPKGGEKTVWKRQQMGGTPTILPLQEGPIPPWSPEPEEQPDIVVRGLVRRRDETWSITLFLVNEQQEPEQRRDEAWVFQPELSVTASDGQPVFLHRTLSQQHLRQSDEELAMAMLYRRQVSFAIGYGVATHAETLPGDPTRAIRLSTRVVPDYDVPRTEAPTPAEIPGLASLELDMKALATTPSSQLSEQLLPLVAAYETWINEQAASINDPSSGLIEYRRIAEQALAECHNTLARIQEGITLLSQHEQAAKAFTFMNQAMWQQRVHTLLAEAKRRDQPVTLENIDRPENHSWRPFQLAFILLNLPALTDLHHPDRRDDASAVADLLWFPTGGGKTEAYLGLTAYTLAIRRLQGTIAGRSGEDGVAVIMRYTLRLLTLQQFQRATTLICACESIRREDQQTWGSTPFRLGMWVGQRTTPNTTEQSEESIQQDRGHYQRGSTIGGVGSPRQLTNCPWCGSPIDAGRDIKIERFERGRGRTFIYCGDALGRCPFSRRHSPEGLPVLVVDEEIYRCLPSLLIATVDKFAQMPWNGATQMLFGQVDQQCSRHGYRCPDLDDKDQHRAVGSFPPARSVPHAPLRPPDLIIQDELHLISGPLGTLVALYETVVDQLCTWEVDGKQVRPKVIAATATIRRASDQVHALFLRQVHIFPPQGLDVKDNFFARQREPSETMPGRRYIGICATGRRLKAALIRVYVAYLSAAQYLYQQYGQSVDPWMTLVGYFNSMNELGGMRRLVEDDVRSRLNKMDQRGLARRSPPILEELTSRRSSMDIPDVLDKLERVFDPVRPTDAPRPIDVALATNMISVGVDVKRLGLMIVAGQPKTTAEYIQATSRVGRNAPGLICVVFNWARPRDLSHYEQFEHYHATFYQQIEALSVTPFAPRALDRGLAALLVSYVRLLGADFNENSRAGSINDAHPYVLEALKALPARAVSVTGSEVVGELVEQTLEDLLAYWINKTRENTGTQLGYKTRKDGQTVGLLRQPGQGEWTSFTCLNSLRDVEPSINLILDERGLGELLEIPNPEHILVSESSAERQQQ